MGGKTMAERAMQWLEKQGALESTLEAIKRGDGVAVVSMDASEVMEWDPRLGAAILEQPDLVAMALHDKVRSRIGMESASCEGSSRLWIRLTAAPIPVVPVEALRSSSKQDGALVQVFGAVQAVHIGGRSAFMRRFRCRECGAAHDIYPRLGQDLELPRCCFYGLLEEDLQAAVYTRYQEILLGPAPQMCRPNGIQPPPVRVQLYDELTGRVNVGDTICVIGHVYIATAGVSPATLPKSGGILGEINLAANNILEAFNLRLPRTIAASHRWTLLEDRGISLDTLVTEFHGGRASGLLRLPNKHCSIAILLSLVATCSNDHSNFAEARFSRRQVHLLFTAPASSSSTTALLRASSLFSTRSVYHAGVKKQILATMKSSGGDSSLHAGSLAMGNGGICVIELFKEFLSKEELAMLFAAMDNGVIVLNNCPELAVPCSSTIWGIHPAPGARNEGLLSCKSKSGAKDLLHRQVLSKFDIIVPLYDDQQYADDDVKQLILDFSKGAAPMDRLESLREHIFKASQVDNISFTEQAQDLIGKYYLLLRRSQLVTPDEFSVSTLECLLRVASASARLCLRSYVLEVPDATLSIFLFEQTQQSKTGSSVLKHLVDRMAVPSSREGDQCFDDFIEDLHADLKRNMDVPFQPEE